MGNLALSLNPTQKKRFVKSNDLHWIKWSFSPDRWGFELDSKWYVNTLLAFFCSVINAYSRQGQTIDGIDVPLDWLLDRCFGPTLSRSALQRALKAIEVIDLIECPRQRPGNNGKRIIFTPTLLHICLHRSTRHPARSEKDQSSSNSNRQFYNKLERVRVIDPPTPAHEKLKRIEPTLKSVMIVLKKTGVDELGRKRIFRRCQIEIARLGDSDRSATNLIDWDFYCSKWPSMSFSEREGTARVDILPILMPKKKQPAENCEKTDVPDSERLEIRRQILKSLGKN